MTILEDSDGNKFEVIKVGKMSFPGFMLAPGGRGLQDMKNFVLRNDDILIFSHPKTGLSNFLLTLIFQQSYQLSTVIATFCVK